MKAKQHFSSVTVGAALGAALGILSVTSVGLGVTLAWKTASLSEEIDKAALHLKDSLHKLGNSIDEHNKQTDEIIDAVKELDKLTVPPVQPSINP